MDNASKALIMAGAILISVAIVGIGIYIFSAANSMTNDAVNSMDSTQVAMFNNRFYSYANDGDEVLGTRARELVNHATLQNVSITKPETIEDRTKYKVTYEYDTSASGYISKVIIAKVSTGSTGS